MVLSFFLFRLVKLFILFIFANKHLYNIMIYNMLLFSLGMPEIVLIALVVLLLFGGKKIPEMMKGLGKGVKSFKEGMNELDSVDEKPASKDKANGEQEKAEN